VVGSLRAGVSRAELGEVTVVITDPVKKKTEEKRARFRIPRFGKTEIEKK